MRAAVIHGPRDIRVEQVPYPRIQRATDAVVRVVATCVCGSDLWNYRGVVQTPQPRRFGHEFVGVVEDVGAAVLTLAPGDFVVAGFCVSCNECVHCRNGITTSCVRGSWWGRPDADGVPTDAGQGEAVRVPLADGTLVATPEPPDPALIPSLLTLSDVMVAGHHAATIGGVRPGAVVAVVGDGAVGLCAVLAAKRLGAHRVVTFSRHPSRQALARTFGADDVVVERGTQGTAALRDLLGGIGADVVLECVGTRESMAQALGSARPGGRIGFVGEPNGGPQIPAQQVFEHNLTVAGGPAPVRAYLPSLIPDVLSGSVNPGLVFDLELPLERLPEAYTAMDERRAIKVLLRP